MTLPVDTLDHEHELRIYFFLNIIESLLYKAAIWIHQMLLRYQDIGTRNLRRKWMFFQWAMWVDCNLSRWHCVLTKKKLFYWAHLSFKNPCLTAFQVLCLLYLKTETYLNNALEMLRCRCTGLCRVSHDHRQ